MVPTKYVRESGHFSWYTFLYCMLRLNTILLLIASSVLSATHILASEFFLYWRYPWFDVPMHILGGIVAALFIFFLADLRILSSRRWRSCFSVMTFVLIVAIVWECYEVVIGVQIQDNYVFDTTIDVVAGLLGGLLGFFIGSKILTLEIKV